MKINCDRCGNEFSRRPSHIRTTQNFCSMKCRITQTTRPCVECGKEVTRCASQMLETVLCSMECSKAWMSRRLAGINRELNPERMTTVTRTKLREAHLGKGEGKSYTKTFGRHTHRIVAEQMLGRPLEPGEVVHHINENRRDNRPENLMVFPSQAEHARWHKEHPSK